MRHARALGGAGLRSADVHAAVDLRRIDETISTGSFSASAQGEARLAARRRPEQGERGVGKA